MDWTPIIDAGLKALTAIIVAVITYGAAIFGAWITKAFAKWKDNWYVNQALEAVSVGVNFAAQTFVDALVEADNFTEADYKTAMQECVKAAINAMPNKAMAYIDKAYGDLSAWIEAQAESILKDLKEE